MKTKVLRFYLSNTDRLGSEPLYERIIYAARQFGLRGATAYRSMMGYGQSSDIHSMKFWQLTEKIPVVIEIVEDEERLRAFMDDFMTQLHAVHKGLLVTLQDCEVLLHQQGGTAEKTTNP